MLRKIKLYGELAEFVGHKEFEIKVDSLAKAVSFLVNNFPQVEKYMSPKYYQVKVGNYAVNEEEIHYPIGQEDIHIVPVIAGAGRGAGKILIGAALIVAAFYLPGNNLGVKFSLEKGLTGGWLGKSMVYLGVGLALMGVSEMLFPLPKVPEFSNEEDPRLSFSFAGVQNTSRAGTPVPVVYGEIVTGSVVISGGIDTDQVKA